MKFRIAAVDLISNTCFPALAADELGYFKAEGLEASIELFPMAHTPSLERIVFAVFHHLNQNWSQRLLKFTHNS